MKQKDVKGVKRANGCEMNEITCENVVNKKLIHSKILQWVLDH